MLYTTPYPPFHFCVRHWVSVCVLVIIIIILSLYIIIKYYIIIIIIITTIVNYIYLVYMLI